MSIEWPVDNEINQVDVPPPIEDDIEDDDDDEDEGG
jgi:hypothetical protein